VAGSLDVIVRFIGDSSRLQSEVSKVEGTGGKVKSWAKGIGAAVGAAFVVTKVKDFTNAGAELQDQMSASEQIFGSAAGSVQKFGKQAADAFGMSQSEALNAANTVAAFGKGAGLAGTDLAKFSTDLVGLSGDLASFRGTSPEQAIEAVGAALRGESEPIRAYGVLLDDATLKARAMSMGLVKASGDTTKIKSTQLAAMKAQKSYNDAVAKYGPESEQAAIAAEGLELAQLKSKAATEGTVPQLTQQQKVLAANAEVFAQTSDAQGDFARTSDSAANQQKKLAADTANMEAALGEALLPAVEAILPLLQSMAEFFARNSGVMVPVAVALVALAVAFKIAALASTLFGSSLALSLGWLLLIVAAIAAVVAIGYLIVKNWDTIKAAAAAVWQFLQTAWDAILNTIKTVAGGIWNAVKGAFDKVLGVIKGVFNWIKTNWPTILGILTGPIGIAVLLITKNWDKIKQGISAALSFIKSVWSAIQRVLTAPIEAAVGIIKRIVDGIKSAIRGAFDVVKDIVGKVTGAVSGAAEKARELGGKIAGFVKAPINAIIRAWNRLEFKIPEVKVFGKTIGGGSIGPPNIPELASGGYVSQTGLAMVHRGETFSGVGRSLGNSYTLNVQVGPGVDPAQTGRTIVEYIKQFERANSADWRRAG
jgi:hypothetical protein